MTLDEVRERVIRELGEDKNQYDEAIAAALRLGHAVFVVAARALGRRRDRRPGEPARRRVAARAHPRSAPHARGQGDADPAARSHAARRGLQVFLGAETAMQALVGELGRRDVVRTRGDADRRARGDRSDADELRQGDVGRRFHRRHRLASCSRSCGRGGNS